MNAACSIMNEWSFFQWASFALASLVFFYMSARLVSAAYFKSKHDHETGKVNHHEP